VVLMVILPISMVLQALSGVVSEAESLTMSAAVVSVRAMKPKFPPLLSFSPQKVRIEA
jgi:hypothetical protein